ncbi:hypothetical protein LJC02_04740, partial [Breznakia sp. OttesenSCG-928-G09]|nr:hypothetical protein [Breznakia sp. OttesenSCG-928-G09]
MTYIRRKGFRITVVLIVLGIFVSIMSDYLIADTKNPIRDKNTNSAYIVEKSARWTNPEKYLAELNLKINGTERINSLDVAIVLDRSGSMDMNFIQEIPDGNGGNKGTHNASSPCLNQDHFYLKETTDVPQVIPNTLDEMHYDEANQRLTVYNGEKKQWVVLDTSNRIHLYFQFGNMVGDENSLALAAYHFKHDGTNFVRISKWDESDVRKGTAEGIWDHGDEAQGCYDRWIEAKKAVEAFSQKLAQINQEEGLIGDEANNVALVPFSIRDETLLHRLNKGTPWYRKWLIQNNYFAGTTVNIGTDETLSGEYNTKVGWTDNPTVISSALSKLFTTHTTDYIYGLGEAYNLLDARSESAKKNKKAVVLLLSDGTPDPASGTFSNAGNIYAFWNNDNHIYGIANALKNTEDQIDSSTFWKDVSGPYQRHSVKPDILARNDTKGISGAYGEESDIISVGYMLDAQASKDRLATIASTQSDYIDIPADATGSTENYLTEKLLQSIVRPGGRNAVLRDEVSKYYYVPEDSVLPEGVTIEGTIESGQTIVWTIGNVYEYPKGQEPSISIPLVLKEEYRSVKSTTYYPTNKDNPEPDLTTPDPGKDGEDTGAKLYYTDFDGNDRYDTIGTPKLPVYPKKEEKPSFTPKPSKAPEDLVNIIMLPSKSPMLGDETNVPFYLM